MHRTPGRFCRLNESSTARPLAHVVNLVQDQQRPGALGLRLVHLQRVRVGQRLVGDGYSGLPPPFNRRVRFQFDMPLSGQLLCPLVS